MSKFVIAGIETSKLNALVKNLMSAMNIDDPVEAVRRINSGQWTVKSAELMRRLAEISVGSVDRFTAAEAFGPGNHGGINFYLWPDFRDNFLGKVEEDVPARTVAVHRLEIAACDEAIMAELRIDLETKKGVIKLAHFYGLIRAQANGEEGPLLVNGYANIAYIEDENGTLWAVSARWFSDDRGWGVLADPVEYPYVCSSGLQVLLQVPPQAG